MEELADAEAAEAIRVLRVSADTAGRMGQTGRQCNMLEALDREAQLESLENLALLFTAAAAAAEVRTMTGLETTEVLEAWVAAAPEKATTITALLWMALRILVAALVADQTAETYAEVPESSL